MKTTTLLFLLGVLVLAPAALAAETTDDADVRALDADADGDAILDTEKRDFDTIDNAPEEKERGVTDNDSTYLDDDSDADGILDAEHLKEVGEFDTVGDIHSRASSGDFDGDGYGDAAAAKELDKASPKLAEKHNISNQTAIAVEEEGVKQHVRKDLQSLDTDDDGDAVPTARETGKEIQIAAKNEVRGANTSRPAFVHKLIRCGSEDCDDTDERVHPDMRVSVSAQDLQSLSAEERSQAVLRTRSRDNRASASDFGLRVAAAAIENPQILNISSDNETTQVRFTERVRLLGIIPINAQATATSTSQGTEVRWPWYARLSLKDASMGSRIAAELREDHDALIHNAESSS